MALVLLDRAKETTTVVGTGTATLLGAVTSYQSLAGVGNGNTTYYCIVDQVGANWEVGIGTYTSAGTTLARTTVLASSNGGALVVFTVGVKDVFVTYPAEKGVWYDASGNVLFTGTTTAANLAYTGTLTGSTGILNIGSGQIYKDASGNVGIGTSSPAQKLTVSATTATQSIVSTTTGNAAFLVLQNSADSSNAYVYATGKELRLSQADTSASSIVTISTQNTERMRIDASGNVGIGTSSPPSDTAVTIFNTGTALSGTGLLVRSGHPGYSGVVANILSLRDKDNTTDTFNIKTDGSLSLNHFSALGTYTNSLTVNASGNVGIGTTVPNNKLTVGAPNGVLGATTVASFSGVNVAASNSSGMVVITSTDSIAANIGGSIGFAANGTLAGYPTGSIAGRRENATAGDYSSYMQFTTCSSGGSVQEKMRIASSGIVTMNAYGAGAATFSASGVISSVSDETWKIKDGVPNNPDEMIQKLKPGYWFYNAEKSPIFGTDRQLGFYAQNVNEAIGIEAAPVPEEGKPWGYYDRSVLAVAVMSLQKALTTIESLTERLTALENK